MPEFTRLQVESIISRIKAKYDAAQRTDENYKHWAYADSLGPREANSLATRRILRELARYERDNNSYCQGMTCTMAGDMIGTGPRLQLLTDDEELNDFFERAFGNWSEAVDLAGKLQLLDMGAIVDGEGFALLVDNPMLFDVSEVTLDLKVIECDLVTEDSLSIMRRGGPGNIPSVDGIRFDKSGNPVEYRVLREHPGDLVSDPGADWLPASQVLHWFRPLRAGQVRGVPEVTPALPLFAQLRRYTLAVLMAAEIAAEIAGFIQTNTPGIDADPVDPIDLLEIVRGQLMTLPQGWGINQLKAEQPTTTYGEFVDRIIKEIARCLELPFAIAAGDSSSYNYASGRLDVQGYQRKIARRRNAMKVRMLNRIWRAWMMEARTVPVFRAEIDRVQQTIGTWDTWGYQWIWDGFEHVDPQKEANALVSLLAKNGATLADWFASKGKDWREQLRQRAKERKLQRELGLSDAEAVGQTMPADNADQGNEDPVPADAEGVPA